MKLKLNRRLLQIGILCILISIALVFFIYSTFKKSVEPEQREKIVYFKYNIERGKTINRDDLILKETPISLIPKDKVTNISDVEGKTLLVNATADEYALQNKFIVRGETNVDVKDMFQISLKTENINNFLGTQIKEGNYYGLLYLNQDTFNIDRIFKVKLVSMVDSSGKIVTEAGTSVVDNIIIALETFEQIESIASYKKTGTFELIKPSDEYWEDFKDTPVTDLLIEGIEDIESNN